MSMQISELQVVPTILAQLGGPRRLSMMIGAKDFMACEEDTMLQFKFKGCKKSNCVQIKLNALDLYDVTFLKVGRVNRKTFELSPTIIHPTVENIYGDKLIELIENETGLFLHF